MLIDIYIFCLYKGTLMQVVFHYTVDIYHTWNLSHKLNRQEFGVRNCIKKFKIFVISVNETTYSENKYIFSKENNIPTRIKFTTTNHVFISQNSKIIQTNAKITYTKTNIKVVL